MSKFARYSFDFRYNRDRYNQIITNQVSSIYNCYPLQHMSEDLYDGRGSHHFTTSSNQRRSDVDDKNGFDFRGRSEKMMQNFAAKDGRHDNRHSKSE